MVTGLPSVSSEKSGEIPTVPFGVAPQITQLRERNSEINFYFTRVISAKNEVDIGGYGPTGD